MRSASLVFASIDRLTEGVVMAAQTATSSSLGFDFLGEVLAHLLEFAGELIVVLLHAVEAGAPFYGVLGEM